MRAWEVAELGLPWEVLREVERPSAVTPGGVVKVEVEAADLNFADILQCQGSYQVPRTPPFIPGLSAVGRITEIGDGVEDGRFVVGQRVIGMTEGNDGGFAEEALLRATDATLLDADVDPIKAAAAHVTYSTAWFALHQRGRIQPGQTVLVLAAAGGVGSAAVELAKLADCWVIAAAGSSKQTVCAALGA